MAFQDLGGLLVRGRPLGAIKTPEETVTITKDGKTHSINYVTIWSTWESSAPAWGTTDPTYADELFLSTINAVKWMGKLAKVSLVYTPRSSEDGEDGLPPDEISETGASNEVDIQLHADFSDNTKFPGKKYDENGLFKGFEWRGTPYASPEHNKAGKESFYAGNKVIVHIKYFLERPDGSALSVIAEPPGYSSSAGKLLRLGSDVNQSGIFWTRRDSYLESKVPWDTDMYATE